MYLEPEYIVQLMLENNPKLHESKTRFQRSVLLEGDMIQFG